MARIRLDLTNNTLEVEGEESFVSSVFDKYKATISDRKIVSSSILPEIAPSSITPKATSIKQSSKAKGKSKESFTILKDLKLFGDGDKNLKSFYLKKSPSNSMENNTVFVYYLTKILDERNITSEHIYTCYKTVGTKLPGALRQSLLDTSSRKGWIDTKSMSSITITNIGENLVEHELPAKQIKEQ